MTETYRFQRQSQTAPKGTDFCYDCRGWGGGGSYYADAIIRMPLERIIVRRIPQTCSAGLLGAARPARRDTGRTFIFKHFNHERNLTGVWSHLSHFIELTCPDPPPYRGPGRARSSDGRLGAFWCRCLSALDGFFSFRTFSHRRKARFRSGGWQGNHHHTGVRGELGARTVASVHFGTVA